jgi:hypothetical protein
MPDENDSVSNQFYSLGQVEGIGQLNTRQWLSKVTNLLHLRHLIKDGG